MTDLCWGTLLRHRLPFSTFFFFLGFWILDFASMFSILSRETGILEAASMCDCLMPAAAPTFIAAEVGLLVGKLGI